MSWLACIQMARLCRLCESCICAQFIADDVSFFVFLFMNANYQVFFFVDYDNSTKPMHFPNSLKQAAVLTLLSLDPLGPSAFS